MEVPGRKKAPLRASVSGASKYEFKFFCKPCNVDGHHRKAAGFCVNCQDYLCVTCYDCHCRPVPSRHHVLQDENDMPRSNPPSKVNDMCTDVCHHHQGEIIKQYCKYHNAFGCSICMTIDHKQCDEVEYIPHLAKDIEESAEYKNFCKKLDLLRKQCRDIKEQSERNVCASREICSKALEAICAFRTEINDHLDELEIDIKKKATQLKDIDIDKMDDILKTCDLTKTNIEATKSNMEKLQTLKQNSQMFISMKKSKDEIKVLQDTLDKANNDNTVQRYVFEPERERLDKLLQIGKLLLDTREGHLKHIHGVKIEEAIITGMTVPPNSRLVVTDYCNNKVILVDTKQRKVIFEYECPSEPWGVTKVSDDQVAVTLPDIQQIHILSVSRTINKQHQIDVSGECFGIINSKNTLIVSYTNPEKLEMLDMSGTVVKKITKDDIGEILFCWPQDVNISPDHSTIYVSDCNTKTVTSLTLDGKVKATYSEGLSHPEGLAVDKYGWVYVGDSSGIRVLAPDFTLIRVLPVSMYPQSLTYCDTEDKLYVGGSGTIQVFQMS